MKKVVVLIALLTFASFATASNVEGVWELVSGEYVDGDGELVSYDSLKLNAIKVLSKRHFSFTTMKGKDFWAAGSGTYELENGRYKEILAYNSFGKTSGTEFEFKTKVEDEYWYNSRWDGDTRVEYEIWRKVE